MAVFRASLLVIYSVAAVIVLALGAWFIALPLFLGLAVVGPRVVRDLRAERESQRSMVRAAAAQMRETQQEDTWVMPGGQQVEPIAVEMQEEVAQRLVNPKRPGRLALVQIEAEAQAEQEEKERQALLAQSDFERSSIRTIYRRGLLTDTRPSVA